MSETHKKLPKLFWVQLALAAIVGLLFFTMPSKDHASSNTEKVEKAAENLAPVGSVSIASTTAGSSKARSGEEVYKASCQACHATGVANAPKLDDKAAWEPRVATGIGALINTALNGKGAMPARGGNPAITDDEIKATVLYMTKTAGFELGTESAAKTETTEVLKQPKEEQTAESNTATLKTATSVAAVASAIKEPIAPAAPKEPVAPSAMKVAEEKIEKVTQTEEKKEVAAAVENVAVDNKEGEKAYRNSCFACHDMGIAGSPKLGDKAAWVDRIATGNDALYASAIKGKGAMPAKGGNVGLSDEAVTAAVNYMVSKAK
jgi:cytochrome c5